MNVRTSPKCAVALAKTALVVAVAAVVLKPATPTQAHATPSHSYSYSVLHRHSVLDLATDASFPAVQLSSLQGAGADTSAAHAAQFPNGAQGWIMSSTHMPNGACMAFARPNDQPGIDFCVSDLTAVNGSAVSAGGSALGRWIVEGAEPNNAESVQITLSDGTTTTAPIISNMFAADESLPVSSYSVLDGSKHVLSHRDLSGQETASGPVVVTSH